MRKTRTLIITTVLVVVLGLLTVSMALAGQGTADSLVSATGGAANPTGESIPVPDFGGVLLLDQSPNQTNGIFSDADCNSCAATGMQSMAENFVLADTYEINRIVIWSGYFPNNGSPADDLDVLIHANNGGTIGANISTESNVPSSRTQTGVVLFGVNEWMTVMTLTNPVQLGAGTYWLEVFNNTAGSPDSYFWEVADPDPVAGLPGTLFSTATPGTGWNPASADYLATQIWGTPVLPPAPGIDISKTPATQDVVMGGNAYFTITVTNTGNVDLDAVDVSDPLVPDCDNTIGTLAVSTTVAYGCTDVGVVISYTNVATVTSVFGTIPGPSASASADVNVVQATSVSLSGFGSDSSAFSPVWLVALLAVVVGFGFALRRKLTA